MKKLFFSILTIINLTAIAQKEDYNWVTGEGAGVYSPNKNQFKFNSELEGIDTFTNDLANLYLYNAAISDTEGNLLLYTNGRAIFNGQTHEIIENGDSLNFGLDWIQFEPTLDYRKFQGGFFFNNKKTNQYILIHIFNDIEYNQFGSVILYESEIRKTLINANTLDVTSKNITLTNYPLTTGGFAACRHGNGRDWWLIHKEYNTDCYIQLLFTPDTIIQYEKQCLGTKHDGVWGLIANFTPDGTKLIVGFGGILGIDIYDFDRCSGLLDFMVNIPRPDFDSNCEVPEDCFPYGAYDGSNITSSNSKWLYTGSGVNVSRWDLTANDIRASRQIAFTTLGLDPYTDFVPTDLGPDGKIYNIFPGYAPDYPNIYNVLHNPNEENPDSIMFDTYVPSPTRSSMSRTCATNYRLGALEGSPCDTLREPNDTNSLETLEQFPLKLSPNPAKEWVTVDYGFFPWKSTSKASLSVSNLLGQEVYQQDLPPYTGFQVIPVKHLTVGTYYITIYDNEKRVASDILLKKE